MIDLHTHILPGIDDGARDVETSLALIKVEKEQGVQEIVFTPHYYGKKNSPEKFLENRQIAFEKISDKIDGIKFRLGAETYFDEMKIVPNGELCKLAIENTKYILLELPFTKSWSEKLIFRLRDFILDTDYTPIIAHVERYPAVRKNPAYLSLLSDLGCLFQVNTKSFVFKKTKNLAFAMLKKGCISCLGSDTHNLTDRPPNLAQIKALLEEKGEGERLEKIFSVMRDVLDGKEVKVPVYQPLKKFFNKYF
ncbi:MAG: hypothetical protein E7343_02470 [Clostridiales bacterium]|nr:hypothetical protein [Clostridiales bacterium]